MRKIAPWAAQASSTASSGPSPNTSIPASVWCRATCVGSPAFSSPSTSHSPGSSGDGADEDVLARLIRKTLYIGVFAFIITHYNNLAEIIYNSFAGLGLKAGGGTLDARRNWFSPARSLKSASTPASRS